MNKRDKSQLLPCRNRVGVPGFRTTYANRKETDEALEKMSKKNKALRRENKALKRVFFDKKSWENMVSESCRNINEERVLDFMALMKQPKLTQFSI